MSAQPSLDLSFETSLEDLRSKVASIAAENRWLRLENERLAKENGELLDDLHGANEAVAELRSMVERAHT